MKQLLQLACIIVFVLTCGIVSTGCQTTNPPTAEAIKYNSLMSTWKVALSAHDVYSAMVLQKKVSLADQADIDRAWDDFRASFKIAVLLAENDLSSLTPANVEKLKDDVITLIYSL